MLKKRLWHRCFPVNFVKFLRTPFLQNTSGWLLLWFEKVENIILFETIIIFSRDYKNLPFSNELYQPEMNFIENKYLTDLLMIYVQDCCMQQHNIIRSSHRRCSVKKSVLRKFAKFTENTCTKVSLAQVFSCEFCEFS